VVDILLAVYNGEKYLQEQLESIGNQTYKDWRLIVRDDGSTDGSADIVSAFRKRNPEKVFLNVNDKPAGGAKGNFLKLLGDAAAPYVMFCDQDDIWLPDKVEKTYEGMKELESDTKSNIPLLVYTDLFVVDDSLNIISDSFSDYMNLPKEVSLEKLIIQNTVTGCTVMINTVLKDLLKEAKDPDKILMHDHFAAIISQSMGIIKKIHEPTIYYRQHQGNSIGAENADSVGYLYRRFKRGRKLFKRDLRDSFMQIDYYLQLYGESLKDNSVKDLLERYARLRYCSKIKRVIFYLKYRVLKYGLIRKIMQIIWG